MKNALRILCSLLLVALTACGGGGGGSDQSTSRNATTTNGPGPTLAAAPAPVTVFEAQPAVFSVAADAGVGPLTYRWYKNSVEIEGATSATLTIPATRASDDGGTIAVAVTDSGTNCTTISPPVNLNVNPVILTHPSTTTVAEGLNATFSVTPAAGLTGLTYQWYKNGSPIGGATSATFNTPAVALTDDGVTYKVGVTHLGTTVMSESATLYVDPVITVGPASQNVTAGQSVRFSVATANIPGLRYQWKQNGVNISGATLSSYTKVAALADNGAQLSVAVSNSAGTLIATSANALFTVTPPALTDLVISEVAACFFRDTDCWVEIYNPTATDINLSGYQLRSTSTDATNGVATASFTYTLPSFNVPADGYVIIAGNATNRLQRSAQMLRLRSGNTVPFWYINGFVELLKSGATVDFVRFGTSTQNPTSAGQWSGATAPALIGSGTDFGRTIVRMYPAIETIDTHTAADWSLVYWPTPAGRNDIPSTAVDQDEDGLPNTAKVAGGTYAGLDLYAMGARPGQRDLFIHVNGMSSTDAGVIPRAEALQKVVDSFAAYSTVGGAKKVVVHFDAGTLFSPNFSIAGFNLGQGNSVVPYEPCVVFAVTICTSNVSTRRSAYDWKEEFMDLRRRPVFHYLLFGSTQKADGTPGSSGLGELVGNDFLITMGRWGLSSGSPTQLNRLINKQASTLMHELGHNLGLRHGGDQETNFKPNYWSVMNYLYQMRGLDANPSGNTAYRRWYQQIVDPLDPECSLPNSPCGLPSQFILNFSDGSSADLNESILLEADNIGRGSTAGSYADWDQDGTKTTAPFSKDLTGDATLTVMKDHNDWGNLKLVFNRTSTGAASAPDTTPAPNVGPPNPFTDDEQPVADEYDLPPSAQH